MTKERAILRRLVEGDNRGDFFISNELLKEVEAIFAQPDINIQYLLDQVSRLTAENAMLKEKWSAPKHEPLSNEQKRLEAIAIKQREAHGIGGGE